MTDPLSGPRVRRPAGRTRYVLFRDELGRLTLRRLWPWHRVLARCAATRLDRQLAAGASPESSARLAARAIQLTSMKFRRDLATSVQRILAAAAGSCRSSAAPAAEPGTDQPAGGTAGQAGRLPSRARPGPGAGRGHGQPAARRRH